MIQKEILRSYLANEEKATAEVGEGAEFDRRSSASRRYFRRAPIVNASQPIIIERPPMGTIAPNQFQFVGAKASTFSKPQKMTTPIKMPKPRSATRRNRDGRARVR